MVLTNNVFVINLKVVNIMMTILMKIINAHVQLEVKLILVVPVVHASV